MINRLGTIIRNHAIIKNLVVRNLKIKYKGTWLGFLWVLVQPLCTIGILYFVFTHVMRVSIPKYPLFLCTGVLPWTFFANALTESTGSIVTNNNLVLRINFSLEILPISYCLSNLVDFFFALTILIPFLITFASPLAWHAIIHLAAVIALHFFFILGLSLLLSSAHVFYKDIGHLLSIVLMFWFYLTPIFYSLDGLPASIIALYHINPMLHFISGYRAVLFLSSAPSAALYGIMLGISTVTFLLGWLVFIGTEKQLVKEL